MPYTLVAPPQQQPMQAPQSSGRYTLVQPPSQEDELAYRSTILPLGKDKTGNVRMAMPGLLKSMIDPAVAATEAIGETARGAPVTTGTVDKTIAGGGVAATLLPGMRVGGGAAQALRGAPTREELRAAGSAGYNQAREMGVDFDANAIAQFASTARANLERHFSPNSAPNTFEALNRLENPPAGGVMQLSGLEDARRFLRNAQTDSDREAARAVIGAIDKLTENPPASIVLAGPAAAAGAVQKEARGNWAALERSKEIAGKQAKAERRAKASNSGRNLDNSLRQRAADVLDQIDKGTLKGYSKEEYAALDDFIGGNNRRNSTRYIANLLGGGGGLGGFLTGAMSGGLAGGAAGRPGMGMAVGVIPPTIGYLAKSSQNRLARKAMGKIDEQVRMRSPLAQQQTMANAPVSPVSPEMRAAMLRASMMYGPQQQGGW